MTEHAIKYDTADDPLEGLDWNCRWETPAAVRLFTSVREFCGLPPVNTELSVEAIQQALREAREILEGAGELDADELLPADFMTFAEACRRADAQRRPARASVAIERRAAFCTVEALIFSLRRGVGVLEEPDTRRRLAELSDEQAVEVGTRLRRFKSEIAPPWTADEVSILMRTRERLK